MYRLLAIAKYEDRYVIPQAHAELADRLMVQQGTCGLDFEGGPGNCGMVGWTRIRSRSGGVHAQRTAHPARHHPDARRPAAQTRRRSDAAPARTEGGQASTYKLCSLLLSYPDDELLAARDEICDAMRALPGSPARASLERFCAWWRDQDPLALAQCYVSTFDLDKRCGLYLTFYGEGDRRERGMALLRLRKLYRAAGLPQQDGELPDFLPVMLEFAAAAPSGRGELVLREHRAALELVRLACASARARTPTSSTRSACRSGSPPRPSARGDQARRERPAT